MHFTVWFRDHKSKVQKQLHHICLSNYNLLVLSWLADSESVATDVTGCSASSNEDMWLCTKYMYLKKTLHLICLTGLKQGGKFSLKQGECGDFSIENRAIINVIRSEKSNIIV